MPDSPAAPNQRHLVTLWNPSYTSDDVMDVHLRILLDAAAETRASRGDPAECYVWWGKLRSANREEETVAHEHEIMGIEAELAAEGGEHREVHLYLTDYRSLYVAHVDEITREDVTATEPDRVPGYYVERGHACDFWFRLLDIRRLVADDLLAVIGELRKLSNVRYHGRPVSLYGGMVNLPLIVSRADGERFFDRGSRDLLADGRLWAEFDAGRAGDAGALGVLQRELRENLFGDDAWTGFEPAAREFVASAERLFRDHRGDATFDFAPVVINFSKAIEVQCRSLLARALASASREERLARVRDRTLDVVEDGPLSLGELFNALGGEPKLRQALATRLWDGSWFVNDLPAALSGWPDVRNRAAHSERVSRDTAVAWRNDLVGVGCEGVLVRLGRVRPLQR